LSDLPQPLHLRVLFMLGTRLPQGRDAYKRAREEGPTWKKEEEFWSEVLEQKATKENTISNRRL
jgi:hypothetical protein